MTLFLDDETVSSLLSLEDAIVCVDRAFRLLADGEAVNVVRRRTYVGTVSLNVMSAIAPTQGVMCVKEYPVVRTDVTQGATITLLLHSYATGELLAVVEANRLTQLRTGAASAVATRALAAPGARTLTVFGAGLQAETQVLAIAAVLPELRHVRIVGRSVPRRDAFAARIRGLLRADVTTGDARVAVESAHVIATATGSAEPVLLGAWVAPGTHVNATGSNVVAKREIDARLLERAAVVAVDDQAVAADECGDLIANGWDQAGVVALGDVLTGRVRGRTAADEITLFESQGLALQDLLCASFVLERARAANAGRRLDGPHLRGSKPVMGRHP